MTQSQGLGEDFACLAALTSSLVAWCLGSDGRAQEACRIIGAVGHGARLPGFKSWFCYLIGFRTWGYVA